VAGLKASKLKQALRPAGPLGGKNQGQKLKGCCFKQASLAGAEEGSFVLNKPTVFPTFDFLN